MKNILIILSSLVLSASASAVNNIKLEGNSITTHNLGGDINLVTTGSGSVRSPGPVGIGERPDLSALFQVTSQSKGAVCSPVMTTTQRDAIASPVKGLQVFNSTTNEPNFYTGSAWSASGGGGGSGITELTGDVTAGPGSGSQAATIGADKVTGSKIRLNNDQYVRARNFANSADINLLKVYGAGDAVYLGNKENQRYVALEGGNLALSTNAVGTGDTYIWGQSVTLASSEGSLAPKLSFSDKDESFVINLKSPNTGSSNYTLTLPVDDGTAGQTLSTDGTGLLSWISSSGANTTLSNLGITSINANLNPDTPNTYTLGEDNNAFSEVHTASIKDTSTEQFANVDARILNDTNSDPSIDADLRHLIDPATSTLLDWSVTDVLKLFGDIYFKDQAIFKTFTTAASVWGSSFIGLGIDGSNASVISNNGGGVFLNGAGLTLGILTSDEGDAVDSSAIRIATGLQSGSANSGDLDIFSSESISGDSGGVSLKSHNGYNASGPINIQSGDSANGLAGDINITAGLGVGEKARVVINALSLKLPVGSGDPGTAVKADMYFNTVSNKIKVYNGTAWETVTSL